MARVQKGWQGSEEINRVIYDPAVISAGEMEKILKGAGTYRETLSVSEDNPPPELK